MTEEQGETLLPFYRVWADSVPVSRPWWWVVDRLLRWSVKDEYTRHVVNTVRIEAGSRGLTIVGEPVVTVKPLNRWQVQLTGTALCVGPDGRGDFVEDAPVDVVDQEEGD